MLFASAVSRKSAIQSLSSVSPWNSDLRRQAAYRTDFCMRANMRGESSSPGRSTTTNQSLCEVSSNGSGLSKSPSQADPSSSEVAAVIAFNFFSSTGIVSANKLVFNGGFRFATTLTFIHFVCTFVGLLILARVGLFKPKKLDVRKASKLAAAGMVCFESSIMSLKLLPL